MRTPSSSRAKLDGGAAALAKLAWTAAAMLTSTAAAQGPPDIVWKTAAHAYQVSGLATSPAGDVVVTGSFDFGIRFWQAADGSAGPVLPASGPVLAFSPDGQRLASAANTAIHVWRVADGVLEETVNEFANPIVALAWSPDGVHLGAADQVESSKIINFERGEVEYDFEVAAESVDFSPDGRLFACGGTSGVVRVYNVAGGQMVRVLGAGELQLIHSVRFSPAGDVLASGGGIPAGGSEFEGTINWWRLSDGELLNKTLGAHGDLVNAITYSPDGRYLLSGARDATLKCWKTSDYSQVAAYDQETGNLDFWPYSGPREIRYAPDGRTFAYGRDDGWVVVARNPFAFARGDVNCDGRVNALDVEPFVLALFDPRAYEERWPECDARLADTNGDWRVDVFDIETFIELLFGR